MHGANEDGAGLGDRELDATGEVGVRLWAAITAAFAERGEGLTTALSYMVAPQLRAGTLVTVLDPFTPPPVPVQLVYPQSRLVAAKVRAFMDFAAPRLTRVLAAEACSPATG